MGRLNPPIAFNRFSHEFIAEPPFSQQRRGQMGNRQYTPLPQLAQQVEAKPFHSEEKPFS